MLMALSAAAPDVHALEPVWEGFTITLNRASRAMSRLVGWDPMLNRNPLLAHLKARTLERMAERQNVDILFAPVSSALIARLPLGVPVVYSSDATARLMFDYYPTFARLPAGIQRRVVNLEAEAMRRADLLIYPTWWAARSAIEDYGIDPDRILVQPFGANLDDPPPRKDVLGPREPGPLRLLFCGVNWQRKGGDTVLGALRHLRAKGIDAELCVLGCTPPPQELPPGSR